MLFFTIQTVLYSKSKVLGSNFIYLVTVCFVLYIPQSTDRVWCSFADSVQGYFVKRTRNVLELVSKLKKTQSREWIEISILQYLILGIKHTNPCNVITNYLETILSFRFR